MAKTFKRRVFEVIQIGNRTDALSRAFDYVVSLLIVAVVGITFALTFELDGGTRKTLEIIELVSTCFFIVEYALRLWTCGFLYKKHAPARFIFSFNGIVDLLTIVAYFVPQYSGFVALRLVRVLRILRLFQINSSFDAFHVIAVVLKNKRNQILSSLTMVIMLILMASLSMYSFEHDAQPDKFTNAFSGIWWAVSAILTVGYGDIYPITPGGEAVAIIMSLLGVCAVAVPTGIIGAGFVEYYSKLNKKDEIKPELLEKARKNNVDVNKILEEYFDKQEK